MSDPVDRRATLVALWVLLFFVLLWSGEALLGSSTWFFHDLRHHHLPWRAWAQQVWAAGDLPLWAPVAHGYPLMADGQAGILYPLNIVLFGLFPTVWAFNLSVVIHHLGAAFGGYVLARVLGRSQAAALVAGAAFGFSGFLISKLVYLGMFQVVAWIPWMVALAVVAVERVGLRWWGAAGLAIGVGWLCGHPQMALYASYATAFVALWRGVERVRAAPESDRRTLMRRLLLGGLLMVLLAICVASPQLLASYELSQFSYREGGVDDSFASMGALPVEEVFNGLFPEPFGYERPADIGTTYHHRAELYQGRGVSFLEDCFYLGVPTVLLGLVAGRHRRAWKWWVLVLLGYLIMLGPMNPLYPAVRALPGMSFFRFPVRAAVFITLAFSQLAAIGVDRLAGWLHAAPQRARRVGLLFFGFSLLVVGAGTVGKIGLESIRQPLTDGLSEALIRPEMELPEGESLPAGAPPPEARGPEEARARAEALIAELDADVSPWSPRVVWPALLGLLLGGLVLSAARGRMRVGTALMLMGPLIAFDLFRFGANFNPLTDASKVMERPPTAVPMLGVPGVYRATVVDRRQPQELDRLLLSSNLGLLHGLEDVIIPSPLRLVRNETYLAHAGLDLGLAGAEAQLEQLRAHRQLVDLSGVRFLFTTRDLRLPDLEPVYAEPERLSDGDEVMVRVYENTRALPRAFAVGCAVAAEPGGALDALLAIEDPGAAAVVEGSAELPPCEPGAAGRVEVRRTGAAALEITADLERDGWLVITETRYPGQVVEVDGEPVPTYQTNYLFQGLPLSAGEHRITWAYRPRHVYTTMGLSSLSLLGGLLWIAVARRRSPPSGAPPPRQPEA